MRQFIASSFDLTYAPELLHGLTETESVQSEAAKILPFGKK